MTVASIALLLRGAGWPAIVGLTACAGAVGAAGVALGHDGVGPALLATAFALLAAGSAFTLEEPSHAVVDVTPTTQKAQTAARALALVVPLGCGLVLVLGAALASATLPAPDLGLALAGNLLLGFALAVVTRLRTGEPGVWASSAAVLLLVLPLMYGPLTQRVHTFPGISTTPGGVSSATWWWLAGGASLIAILIAAHRNRVT